MLRETTTIDTTAKLWKGRVDAGNTETVTIHKVTSFLYFILGGTDLTYLV